MRSVCPHPEWDGGLFYAQARAEENMLLKRAVLFLYETPGAHWKNNFSVHLAKIFFRKASEKERRTL